MDTPQIEISYDVDSNGILTVTAVEKSTGKSENLVIKNDNGRLSEEQIKKMVDDAEQFKAEDELQALKIEKRNGLDQIIYTSLKAIGDQNPELTEFIKETETWLENNPDESPDIYDEKIKEIQEKIKHLPRHHRRMKKKSPTQICPKNQLLQKILALK